MTCNGLLLLNKFSFSGMKINVKACCANFVLCLLAKRNLELRRRVKQTIARTRVYFRRIARALPFRNCTFSLILKIKNKSFAVYFVATVLRAVM